MLLGDVKNMHTNLDHEHIMMAVKWVLDLAKAHLPVTHGIRIVRPTKRTRSFQPFFSKGPGKNTTHVRNGADVQTLLLVADFREPVSDSWTVKLVSPHKN